MRKDSGFTLIELMITVTVLAILLGAGIPAMIDFVNTNRRAAAANAFVSVLQQARSVSAGKAVHVVVCHSTNGSGCSGTSNPDWSDGWISFIDNDPRNGTKDAGETLLATQAARGGLKMPSTRNSFTFTPGFRASTNGTVGICPQGSTPPRFVIVNSAGRPRLAESGSASCP